MKTTRKIENRQILVVVGLVVKEGEILMVKRNEPEQVDAHLKWEYPGGKIEKNETPQEAIVREVREETGAEISIKRLLPHVHTTHWEYRWGIQQTIIIGFECEFIRGVDVVSDHRVKLVKWFPINELTHLEMLPGAPEFLRALRS